MRLAQVGDAVIEQILSGELEEPVDYDQDDDEWVVLLQGGAELEVDGESTVLRPGDWIVLRSRTPHRLVRTTPGTSWLVARVPGR